MFLAFYFVAVGLLVFVPSTHGTVCGEYMNVCYPSDYQEAFCCGAYDQECCYYTNVVTVWWFWLLLVFSILFFSICITALCCRHHRRSRVGYVVVRGETRAPATVVHTQSGNVTSSGPAYPQYYGSVPSAPQGYKASAPPAYGYPSAQPPPMYQG